MEGAKKRAAQRGLDFDLTRDWLISEVDRNGYRCALSGIKFFAVHEAKCFRNPFAPSIDRIDCSKGYTRDNVRILIFAMNVMLSDWGTQIFERVSESYRGSDDHSKVDFSSLKFPTERGHYRKTPRHVKTGLP